MFDTIDFLILIKRIITLIFLNDFYTGFLVISQIDDILLKLTRKVSNILHTNFDAPKDFIFGPIILNSF